MMCVFVLGLQIYKKKHKIFGRMENNNYLCCGIIIYTLIQITIRYGYIYYYSKL